jgi:hypothetical protein
MNLHRVVFVSLLLAVSAQPGSALIVGGGPQTSECYAGFSLGECEANVIDCQDGDSTCDSDGVENGSCTITLSLCAFQEASGRTAAPVSSIKAKVKPKKLGFTPPANPPLPASAAVCGPESTYTLPVSSGKLRKRAKAIFSFKAKSSGKPKIDKDKLTVLCQANIGGGTCGAGCFRRPPNCAANPAGASEPNEIVLTVDEDGTDLDNGWKGPSMNFPTPAGTTLQLCLTNCDSTADPLCDTSTPIGAGTFNKNTFGPPLPLFTAGVPVCVINDYDPAKQPSVVGTANLQSGEVTGLIHLLSHVYLTEEENVCPKCINGACNDGPRQGQACVVDGTVEVVESSAANKIFPLSKDCPPNTNAPAGTLVIDLPLTTGTSTLAPQPGGTPQTPCVQQPGQAAGVQPNPDQCGAGASCGPNCGGPQTCARMATDPTTGLQACIDAKGGVSQNCCSNDASRACQPTRNGTPVSRTGKAGVYEPAWPDPTYPKSGPVVTVATFCEAATGTGSVDGLTGLPGPAAIQLPNNACIFTPSSQ